MDFLQTYPQVAEYVEEFNYFGSLSFIDRLAYIHEHTVFEMAVMGFIIWSGVEIYKMLHQPPQNPWTFGKARWGTMEDARKANMLVKTPSGKRILVGKMGDEWMEAEIHANVVGTNGGGKGVSIVYPNLLTWKGSLICNDLKGENFITTQRYRREVLGQEVYAIDPYGEVTDETAHFNPIDYVIDGDPAGVKEANTVAEVLFPSKDGGNAFFDEGARGLIATTIMYLVAAYPPEKRNLGTVREILTLTPEEKMAEFRKMQECTQFSGAIRKGINQVLELAGEPTAPKKFDENGNEIVVAQEKKSDGPNETVLDMYATVNIAMKFLDDERLVEVLKKSDMDLNLLKYTKQSIYLIVSASDLAVSSMLMRFIYSYALKKCVTSKRPLRAVELELEPMKEPVLFLMDEFAQLKKFQIVRDMMPLARGYNVRFLIILQGQKQLEEYYQAGGADFMVNATKVYLGAEDNDTAEEISRFCGDTTKRCDTEDLTTKKKNVGWHGVRLITPGDVRTSSPLEPFVIKGGLPPFRIRQARHYEEPYFKGKYDDYKAG